MQIGRLFEIVYLLLNKKKMTARELAERFEVSVRTIYRDVDALSAAGIPVYTLQGTGGGIFLQEDFVLNKSLLSSGEQDQILLALQSLNATAHPEAADLLERMGNLFHKSSTDWIEVDFTRWGNLASDREKFKILTNAVIERHPLSFYYVGAAHSAGVRTVSPLKLCFKSKSWYLHGFCHSRKDYRFFKLTRMSNLTPLPQTFNPDDLPPPPAVSSPPLPPPATVTVTMRFSPAVAYRLLDEFEPADIRAGSEGYSTVTMEFPDDQWLYGYILSFGNEVEILSPAAVRDRLRDIALGIYQRYGYPQRSDLPDKA